jgi:hypothetical protein
MIIKNSSTSQVEQSASPAASGDTHAMSNTSQDGRFRASLTWEEGDGALLSALLMLISAPYLVLMLVTFGPYVVKYLISLLHGIIG